MITNKVSIEFVEDGAIKINVFESDHGEYNLIVKIDNPNEPVIPEITIKETGKGFELEITETDMTKPAKTKPAKKPYVTKEMVKKFIKLQDKINEFQKTL